MGGLIGMIRLERLTLPTVLNRQWRAYRGRTILSEDARKKRTLIMAQIHEQLGGPPEPIAGPCQVSMIWTPRDRRIADVDAYIKGALDAMQAAGVYLDDSLVDQITCQRVPRPEYPGWWDVEIWEIGG